MSSPPPTPLGLGYSNPNPSNNTNNPRKRPPMSSASSSSSQPASSHTASSFHPQSAGANKRPRLHPLRQTSFPASSTASMLISGGGDGNSEPVRHDRSRSFSVASDAGSVTGSFTGSLGDGVFGGQGQSSSQGKKRGRKRKADRDRDDAASSVHGRSTRMGSVEADGASVRGGARSTRDGGGRGARGGSPGIGADEGDEEDDLDDEGGELLGDQEGAADTEAEKKNLAILVDAFNPIQSARYDLYKRAKLRKETLRRIVNHALSQSVPASVVTTINGFTKVFVGEIIEKARTVQEEWAEAFDRAAYERYLREQADRERQRAAQVAEVAIIAKQEASTHTNGPSVPTAHQQTNATNKLKQESPDTIQVPSTLASPSTEKNQTYPLLDGIFSFAEAKEDINPPLSLFQTTQQPPSTQEEFQFPPNPHRGQLLPSHLREALRRCKRDGGDGAGTSGLSLLSLGVRGANTWNAGIGGRKLFR